MSYGRRYAIDCARKLGEERARGSQEERLMPTPPGAHVGHRIIPAIDPSSFTRVVDAAADIGAEVLIDNDHLVFFAG